ncbi:MAG TPA: Hsp20/alpha crystallin family protein [Cyclobacteriaceae bacterium]|nr:Hsp20/alpha crystallin family protein [Cyclobacteriaceae bacterium]
MNSPKLNIPQELITSIDMLNTLNGGTSQPNVKLKHFSTHRQINIRVPGIALDNVKVEINNNKLMIYYLTTVVSQQKEISLPKGLYNKSIPYFVDMNSIKATQEKDSLVVRLPFNELYNGYHRDIPLSH